MKTISVNIAANRIARAVGKARTEQVRLGMAAGRVIAEDVAADRPQPPFDRVMMDGFAICFHTWAGGQRVFRVETTKRAGDLRAKLSSRANCIEIMTGASLPEGCDTVIPLEQVRVRDGIATIADHPAVTKGRFVHRAGSDVRKGRIVLRAGTRMNGTAIGVAASVGKAQLNVFAEPRIAIVSTGDELIPVSATPAPHQLRRSNASAVAASLAGYGFGSLEIAHIADSEAAQQKLFAKKLNRADVLIVIGGVSKGRFDFVPRTLASLGVEEVFRGVLQRPGRPLWFGTAKEKLVFGLPGNPVSALICLHRQVLPALIKLSGLHEPVRHTVELASPVPGDAKLTFYRSVRLKNVDGKTIAEVVPFQNSGDFFGLPATDGFVEIPPGQQTRTATFWPWY